MNPIEIHSSTAPVLGNVTLIRRSALAASVLVLAMVLVFLFTGIGQDPLQFVHPVAQYTELLLRDPPILRLAIGLDNAFVLAYATMFLALGARLWREGAPRELVVASGALLGLSALLDLAENMHFLLMISMAQQGLVLGGGEIELQVWESLLKFHASYLGLLLLGLALPTHSGSSRLLSFLLRWVQWPVGLLIYIMPASLAKPLVIVRFTFFLVSLLLLAAVYWRGEAD
jgi:hypothetical protein